MTMFKHLIWDWNGTLLDDVDLCVKILNELLAERQMQPVTRGLYRQHFSFPVRDYYVKIGFDFEREDFSRLSEVFVERYRERSGGLTLQSGAFEALRAAHAAGITQSVVSAMERGMLGRMLDHFGIAAYFSRVRGLDHLHATSKIALGVALREELRLAGEEILLVGDTLHDLETAQAIGCRCLLFSGGHQTRSRLSASGATVIEELSALSCQLSAGKADSLPL